MVSTELPRTARWTFVLGALFSLARRRTVETIATAGTKLQRPTCALLELAGAAAVVKGCFVLAPWLGWLCAGAMLLTAGWMLEPRARRDEAA